MKAVEQIDPYAHQPARWVGKACSFDHQGKRLVGRIEKHLYAGRTVRGDIPDYQITVRGGSGATVTVSMVESYMRIEQ